MTATQIRRVQPDDSLEDLTGMLRRAFSTLGSRGLNCTCVDQTVDMTRRRIRLGDCFVATRGNKVVGTITLHAADRASPVLWYRAPKVASIHQLAVDPDHQGTGVGQALLRIAESWARARQFVELALDTPEPAEDLHAFYGRRGFRLIDTAQLKGKSYRSVILSKTIGNPPSSAQSELWETQDYAEMA